MISYIISFILCSGLLLLIYRLLLSNENLYRFNRFYLLFSLALSLAIPLIKMEMPAKVFETGQQMFGSKIKVVDVLKDHASSQVQISEPDHIAPTDAPIITGKKSHQQIVPQHKNNYLAHLPVVLYMLVVAALLVRFIQNLCFIKRVAVKNPAREIEGATLVLVDEDVAPHSFLRYIFINKANYDNGMVEPEIICHEQTHVAQLHSLDVIVVELFQAIFWINPFIPLYRKAIQLNHEFLADEGVVKTYTDTPTYQYLLLAKASQHGSAYLTSQFNYLITKKRLIMMTKTTTTKIALYKLLALTPLLAGAVLLFSNKSMAVNKPAKTAVTGMQIAKQEPTDTLPQRLKFNHKPIPASSTDAPQAVLDEFTAILKKYHQPVTSKEEAKLVKSFSQEDKWRLEVLYTQMSQEQQKKQFIAFYVPGPPPTKSHPTAAQLIKWQDAANYGVWIDGKRIKNADLVDYKPSDFDLVMFSRLLPIAVKNDKFHFQVDLMTPKAYAKFRNRILATDDWEIWHKMKNI